RCEAIGTAANPDATVVESHSGELAETPLLLLYKMELEGQLMNQHAAVDATETGYPSTRYSWYVVTILTLTYAVSFIDRQIMALMIEPIRHDLGISDTQV